MDEGEPIEIDREALTTGSWTMRFGGGPEGDIVNVDGHPITITFNPEGTLGGTSACNGYGGNYEINGTQLILGEIFMEGQGCADAVQMAEAAYHAALRDVTGINLVGDELALSGPASELIFSSTPAVPINDVLGRTWLLEARRVDGVSTSVEGDPATLQLLSDGSFTGSTGCRDLFGRFSVFGSQVNFNQMTADGECPASLATQDSAVVTVLGDGFDVEVDGDQLIVSSRGNQGLQYRQIEAESVDDLVGTEALTDQDAVAGIIWTFVGGDSPDGEILEPGTIDPDARITLALLEDSYEGIAICNEYGGTVLIGINAASIALGIPQGPQEGCGEPFDGPGSLVEQYLAALPQMTEGAIEGGGERLVLNGNDIELLFERSN